MDTLLNLLGIQGQLIALCQTIANAYLLIFGSSALATLIWLMR